MSHPSLVKEYQVRAVCEVKLGGSCKVAGQSQHCGQEAVIVGLNEYTVNIRLTTGKKTNTVIENVDPENLLLTGTFRGVERIVPEEKIPA